MSAQDAAKVAAGLRNCDLIEDMDYLKACPWCAGEGDYNQTYTAGCGGGYLTMKGRCDLCDGDGVVLLNRDRVSKSHLAQIETKRRKHLETRDD